jgi:hypothetical protein
MLKKFDLMYFKSKAYRYTGKYFEILRNVTGRCLNGAKPVKKI